MSLLSAFQPLTDQLWSDFDMNQDFSIIFQDQPDLNMTWPGPESFDLPLQSADTLPISVQTPAFVAPIPPPPAPGPPTPSRLNKSKKRFSSTKEGKRKRLKKARKEIVMPSSPPIRAFKHHSTENDDPIFHSEATSPAKVLDFNGASWEEFLVQSESEERSQGRPEQRQELQEEQEQEKEKEKEKEQEQEQEQEQAPPVVAFTAVNSTVDSAMEFNARQILLNAEFTPASSPDQSSSQQTESESGSPVELTTPFPETPAPPSQSDVEGTKNVLEDITSDKNNELTILKKPRGRPRGWRKPRNSDNPILTPEMPSTNTEVQKKEKKRKQRQKKEEDQWSVRMRTSIKDAMLEHLAKGIIKHKKHMLRL